MNRKVVKQIVAWIGLAAIIGSFIVAGVAHAQEVGSVFRANTAFEIAHSQHADYFAGSEIADFNESGHSSLRLVPQCFGGQPDSCSSGLHCATVGGEGFLNTRRGGCVPANVYCSMQGITESKAPASRTINGATAPTCDGFAAQENSTVVHNGCGDTGVAVRPGMHCMAADMHGVSQNISTLNGEVGKPFIAQTNSVYNPSCGALDSCPSAMHCAVVGVTGDSRGGLIADKVCLTKAEYDNIKTAVVAAPNASNPRAYRLDPQVEAEKNTPQVQDTDKQAIQTTATKAVGIGINLNSSGLEAPDPSQIRGLAVARDANELLTGILNFFLSFVAIVAVGVLVYGGFMFITSGIVDGNADKGKKAITGAVTGIILIISSWTIVNTVINLDGGRFSGGGVERVRGGSVLLTYNFKDNRGGSITLYEGTEAIIPEFTNGRALLQGQTVTVKCTEDAVKTNTRHLSINTDVRMDCTYNVWDSVNVNFRFTNL